MKFRNAVIVAGLVLVAPAAWLFASGLNVGLAAPGAEPSDQLEARLVLWRDVLRARSRRSELASVGLTHSPPGPPPVYEYVPLPRERLTQVLPTCPDHVVEAQTPDTNGVFRAGTIPVLFPLRGMLDDDATYVAHAHKFSIAELALLHACFRATPFGAQCDDWMEREAPSRDEVLARLVERGWVGAAVGSVLLAASGV